MLTSIALWFAGAKLAAGRFINRESLAAIAVVCGCITVLIAGVLIWWGISSAAREGRDSWWKWQISEQRTQAKDDQAKRQAAIDTAADTERAKAEVLDEVVAHAQALEQELARLRAGGDPVIYPKSLATELRK